MPVMFDIKWKRVREKRVRVEKEAAWNGKTVQE